MTSAHERREPRDVAGGDIAPTDLHDTIGHWGERIGELARSVAARVERRRVEGEPGEATGASDSEHPRMQHAERLVDDFSRWAGRYTSAAGRQLARLASRAREEAEDIWAEAQALQHRETESARAGAGAMATADAADAGEPPGGARAEERGGEGEERAEESAAAGETGAMTEHEEAQRRRGSRSRAAR